MDVWGLSYICWHVYKGAKELCAKYRSACICMYLGRLVDWVWSLLLIQIDLSKSMMILYISIYVSVFLGFNFLPTRDSERKGLGKGI